MGIHRACTTSRTKRVPRGARTQILNTIIVASLAALCAACGSAAVSPGTTDDPAASSHAAHATSKPQMGPQDALLAFANCMRANGVPDFPEPDSQGHLLLPSSADVNSPNFLTASQHCQSVLPSNLQSGNVTSPANLAGLAKYALCMQKKGFDDSALPNGSISFPNNVDPTSPEYQAANAVCVKLVPDGLP